MEQEPMVQTDPVAFTVKLTAKDLWKFSLYHSNKGMLGIFNVIFSLAAIFLLVTTWSPTQRCTGRCFVCALMFTVWQPFSPVSEGGEAVEASGYPESNGSLLQQGRHRGDSGNGAAGAYLGKYRTGRADPGYDYCIHGDKSARICFLIPSLVRRRKTLRICSGRVCQRSGEKRYKSQQSR